MYKKRYGQNFLINNNISKKILFEEKITNQDILEIGTGNLALTKLIVTEKPKKFIGIEVDTDMRDVYRQNNILENIIFEDALSVNERKLFKNGNFSIISNLPFNISSELIIKWCRIQCLYKCINSMTLMFQKELAERIIAKKNTKKYGRLSILCSAFFLIEEKLKVSKNNFFPKPKVDATVLKFIPHKENKIKPNKFITLEKLTRIFFNERRKKNKKKIIKVFSDDQILEHNLKRFYDLRPENLDNKVFFELCDILKL